MNRGSAPSNLGVAHPNPDPELHCSYRKAALWTLADARMLAVPCDGTANGCPTSSLGSTSGRSWMWTIQTTPGQHRRQGCPLQKARSAVPISSWVSNPPVGDERGVRIGVRPTLGSMHVTARPTGCPPEGQGAGPTLGRRLAGVGPLPSGLDGGHGQDSYGVPAAAGCMTFGSRCWRSVVCKPPYGRPHPERDVSTRLDRWSK
jgi:hypothetical protein